MRLFNSEFFAAVASDSVAPVFVARIEFSQSDVLYLTSAPVAGLSGSNVIMAAEGFSGVSQRYDHHARISTVGSVTVEFATSDIAPQFASRFNSGVGLRNKPCTVYVGTRSIGWESFEPLYPFSIQSVNCGHLVTRISAADSQRGLDADLFQTPTGIHLTKTLPDTQTSGYLYAAAIGTGGEPDLPVVYHDASHQLHPDSFYGIVLIEDELIVHGEVQFDEVDGWRVPIIERSVLGSLRQTHEFKEDAALDRQASVKPWVYLEGPVLKVMYALLTGEIWGTLETLPVGWHAGVSSTYVNLAEFLAYPEIWDTQNDTGRMVRINGPKPTRARSYIQEKMLVWAGGLMPVRPNGALGFKPRVATLRNAPADIEITDDDVLDHGDIEWDQNQLGNVIRVQWQKDPVRDLYLQETLLLDSTSGNKNGYAPQTVFDLPFVHSTQSTQNRLIQFLNTWRDLYAEPPMEWSLTVGPHMLGLEVGDIVHINYDGITDPTTGNTVNRSWEVMESQLDWATGEINLSLFGATGKAEPVPTTDSGEALPDSFYETGTDLASVVDIADGEVVSAFNLAPGVYHYHGDLSLGSHTHSFNGVVQLRVRGFLSLPVNCHLDGRGKGNNTTQSGAFGSSIGGLSHISRARRSRNTYNPITYANFPGNDWNPPSTYRFSRYRSTVDGESISAGVSAVQFLGVDYINGEATITSDIKPGGAGATSRSIDGVAVPSRPSGGASIALVSRGISIDTSARIDTSGADGSLGYRELDTRYSKTGRGFLKGWKLIDDRYYSSTGSSAGGLPGALYCLIDGFYLPPNLTAAHIAESGHSPSDISSYNGTSVTQLGSNIGRTLPGSGDEDFAGVATVVQYAPPPEDTGDLVGIEPPAPDTVSILAVNTTPDLPPTEDKTNASIEIDVDRGSADSVVIYYREQGVGVWRRHAEVLSSAVIVVPNQAGSWELQARPVSGRIEQTSGPVAVATIQDTPKRPVGLLGVQYSLSSDPSYGERGDYLQVEVIAEADTSDPQFSHCRFERRNTNGGAWMPVPASGTEIALLSLHANGTTWQFRVTPISLDDLTGPTSSVNVVLPRLATDEPQDEYTPVPPIKRLRIVNADPDYPERWIGAAPEFAWARISATQSVSFGSEGAAGAGAGTEDSWLRGYRIRVYDADGILKRSEIVTENLWEYAPELNKADGVGRAGEIEVQAMPRIGTLGEGQRIPFNNPSPAAPQNIREEVGYTTIGLSWDLPLDADFHGVKLFVADASEDPFEVDKNPRLIRNNQVIIEVDANTQVTVGLESWDQFGPGGRTTREVTARKVPVADIEGLGPWGTIDQADRDFINAWLAQDAVESEKVANIAAAKITAGVIQATVGIGSEGRIYTDNNGYQVIMGAVDRPEASTNPLMLHMWDGANAVNWFDAAGHFGLGNGGVNYDGNTVTVDGHIVAKTLDVNGVLSGEVTAGTITGLNIEAGQFTGSLFQTLPDTSGHYGVYVGNVLRTAISPNPLLIHTWNGTDSTFSVDEAGKIRARDMDISGDSTFAGLLEVAKIDSDNVQIKSVATNRYSRSVAVISGNHVFSGGSSTTAVAIGSFKLPGHPSAGPGDTNFISTQNGAFIVVTGLVQFRNSVWTTQYRRTLSGGSTTSWNDLDDSPTISLHEDETNDARVFAWSFGIDIWSIASTSDRLIEFRLRRVDTAGSTPRINSWRISMWYSNL